MIPGGKLAGDAGDETPLAREDMDEFDDEEEGGDSQVSHKLPDGHVEQHVPSF